jgi:hypothetical protein
MSNFCHTKKNQVIKVIKLGPEAECKYGPQIQTGSDISDHI